MCESGVPLHQIETLLTNNRILPIRDKFQQVQPSSQVTEFSDFESDVVHFWRKSPQRHACFLRTFWQWERITKISLTPQTCWLSCDNTLILNQCCCPASYGMGVARNGVLPGPIFRPRQLIMTSRT